MIVTVAGMGVNSIGVRQIAASVGTGDTQLIAGTAAVVRRLHVVLGLLGAALLVLFAEKFSTLTFGNEGRRGAIMLLSVAALCRLVSAGQGALLQGMRRIFDLAHSGSIGTLLGAVASILLVSIFRESGVAPSIVLGAAIGLGLAWWYSRRLQVRPIRMPLTTIRVEASEMLALGLVFMVSALAQTGGANIVRSLVVRILGTESAGLYQAAWALGGLYVGMILTAMGADFYPRLVSAAKDNLECNRLVNEQAQFSLLLAGLGVISTVTFASLAIWLFYTAEFLAAVDVLRWFCVGMALRVITWPMGFINVTKGRKGLLLFRNSPGAS